MDRKHSVLAIGTFVAAALLILSFLTSPAFAFINIYDYGATGNGSDATTAIQNAVAAASNGDTIYLPAGTYVVSSTIVISNVRGLRIVGDGIDATKIVPSASLASQPVFKFVDCVDNAVADLSILGNPSAPPSAGIESDSAVGGFATRLSVTDVEIGSNTANSIVDGIKYDAPSNADWNNDLGFFENVTIMNFTHAGYSFLPYNSLVHTIVGGSISNGPIGVYSQGGSFKMVGTTLSNISDVDFDFQGPGDPSIGGYEHPIVISNVSSENSTALLQTGTQQVSVSMTNIDARFSGGKTQVFDFESNKGMLFLDNSYLYNMDPTSDAKFAGGTNQVVNLTNNFVGFTNILLSGRLMAQANCWSGNPYTMMTRGSKIFEVGDICGRMRHRMMRQLP